MEEVSISLEVAQPIFPSHSRVYNIESVILKVYNIESVYNKGSVYNMGSIIFRY